MITIFAVPKPFTGPIGVIQRNAIASWLTLRPRCEVLLIGDEPGTAEMAAHFGVRHEPSVLRTEWGTPRVDSVFAKAESLAAHPLLCYVNADIMLLSDFMPAVQQARTLKPRALLVGARWDVHVPQAVDFSGAWEAAVRALVGASGRRHAHTGLDYFVFPRGCWERIPPFAIGRWTWDSWLIYAASAAGVPVVDLSRAVLAIHQNHPRADDREEKRVQESQRNLALAGGYGHAYTLLDAPFELINGRLRRRWTPYVLYRWLVNGSANRTGMRWVWKMVRMVRTQWLAHRS